MTYKECIIVSAYTGYLMCDVSDLQKAVQEKLNRPVLTHEMADKKVQEEIQNAFRSDFIGLCKRERRKDD